jgi:flagellar protein FlaG
MNLEPIDRAVQARPAPVAGAARAAVHSPAAEQLQAAQEAVARAAADRAAAEQVRRAMAQANRDLGQKGSELRFEFDEDAQRVIVRLIDTRTREVLRQIPPEEALAIARALQHDPAAGALLRAQA